MIQEQPLASYKVGLGISKLTIYRDHLLFETLTSSREIPIKTISYIEIRKWTKMLVLHMNGGAKEEIQLAHGNTLKEAEALINSIINSNSSTPPQAIQSSIDKSPSEPMAADSVVNDKWYINLVVVGFLVIIVVFSIAYLGSESSPTPTMSIEQQRGVVLRIEQKIYQIEQRHKPAMERYSNAFQQLGEGRGNVFDAYAAAADAKTAAESMNTEYFSLCRDETPREMPREIRDDLRDVCTELSTAYFVRAKAFDSAGKFLDDQRPSDFREFEENIKQSDRFIIAGIAKLFEVKTKLGIDLEEQEGS